MDLSNPQLKISFREKQKRYFRFQAVPHERCTSAVKDVTAFAHATLLYKIPADVLFRLFAIPRHPFSDADSITAIRFRIQSLKSA